MLKGAFIGIGIVVACLLPPILHFLTGPLGPFIGGFVAGTKTRATPQQAIGIGLAMGLVIATLLSVGLVIATLLFVALSSRIDLGMLRFVSPGLFVYVAALGTTGAMVGGHVASRVEAHTP
jgi:hypothetical protein